MGARLGGDQDQRLPDRLQLPQHAVMETVGRWVTRYPDAGWLDLLAERATRGRWRAADLAARVHSKSLVDAEVDATDLAYLGWLLATVATSPEELRAAYLVMNRAVHHRDQPTVPQRVWNTWLQCAYLAGELDDAVAVTPQDRVHPDAWWAVHTDSVNPFLHSDTAGATSWLHRFSRPFTAGGAVPLRLREDEGAAPFDRLTAATAPDRDGPLISVVMPVFNPTSSLRTSVASILAQTWRNLEVILVDDASTAGTEHLQHAAAMDPRVRLVTTEQNAGAYAARNRGLAAARGALLTFQDADDYSHPQRLEHQADSLLGGESVVASVGRSVRATNQLAVTNIGYRLIAANLSSMMIRREEVLRRLGGFDPVRRGADTEFRDRIRQVFGTSALRLVEHPLAVVQLTPGSLSRGEMGSIHRHSAREAYIAAARGWHTSAAARRADPHVQPPARAPFPAPAHVTGRETAPVVADVVLLAPVEAGPIDDLGPLVQALVDAGHRVAVKEFVGPDATLRRLRGVGPVLARLLARGRVRWLMPDEPVSTSVAIVHEPQAVLTMPEPVLASVTAAHYLVVAETVPGAPRVHTVEQELARVTGRAPCWLPATNGVRATLTTISAAVLPPAPWHVTPAPARPWRGGQHPVVGLLSPRLLGHTVLDDGRLVPRNEHTALWAYGPYPARTQGRPVTRIRADQGRWPQFLSGLSAFLTPDVGSVHTTVLDCWAAGVLVLAPERARPVLGSCALYVGDEPHRDIDALLEDLAADRTTGEKVLTAAREQSSTSTSPAAVQKTFAMIVNALESR